MKGLCSFYPCPNDPILVSSDINACAKHICTVCDVFTEDPNFCLVKMWGKLHATSLPDTESAAEMERQFNYSFKCPELRIACASQVTGNGYHPAPLCIKHGPPFYARGLCNPCAHLESNRCRGCNRIRASAVKEPRRNALGLCDDSACNLEKRCVCESCPQPSRTWFVSIASIAEREMFDMCPACRESHVCCFKCKRTRILPIGFAFSKHVQTDGFVSTVNYTSLFYLARSIEINKSGQRVATCIYCVGAFKMPPRILSFEDIVFECEQRVALLLQWWLLVPAMRAYIGRLQARLSCTHREAEWIALRKHDCLTPLELEIVTNNYEERRIIITQYEREMDSVTQLMYLCVARLPGDVLRVVIGHMHHK
jgi:hypothetical protein